MEAKLHCRNQTKPSNVSKTQSEKDVVSGLKELERELKGSMLRLLKRQVVAAS